MPTCYYHLMHDQQLPEDWEYLLTFDTLLPADLPNDARRAAYAMASNADNVWHAQCRLENAIEKGYELAGTRRRSTLPAEEVVRRAKRAGVPFDVDLVQSGSVSKGSFLRRRSERISSTIGGCWLLSSSIHTTVEDGPYGESPSSSSRAILFMLGVDAGVYEYRGPLPEGRIEVESSRIVRTHDQVFGGDPDVPFDDTSLLDIPTMLDRFVRRHSLE